MLRLTISIFVFILGNVLYGQSMVLDQNLVLTETMVVSEDLTIEANGFSISCDGCDPMFKVIGDAHLQLNNARFPRTFESWIKVMSATASAAWNSPRMVGSIEASVNE